MSIKRRKPVIRQIIKENTFVETTQKKPVEVLVECSRCGRQKLNTEMISCHNKGKINYECLVKDTICKSDKDIFNESLEKINASPISPVLDSSQFYGDVSIDI